VSGPTIHHARAAEHVDQDRVVRGPRGGSDRLGDDLPAALPVAPVHLGGEGGEQPGPHDVIAVADRRERGVDDAQTIGVHPGRLVDVQHRGAVRDGDKRLGTAVGHGDPARLGAGLVEDRVTGLRLGLGQTDKDGDAAVVAEVDSPVEQLAGLGVPAHGVQRGQCGQCGVAGGAGVVRPAPSAVDPTRSVNSTVTATLEPTRDPPPPVRTASVPEGLADYG